MISAKTMVQPRLLDIFDPNLDKCAYCGRQTYVTKWVINRHIFHCPFHVDDADRDIRDYLRLENKIRRKDALEDPIFSILPFKLTVKRSDGTIEHDWELQLGPEEILVLKDNEWKICVCKIDPPRYITKIIPVTDLKLSLPGEHVDEFIVRLESLSKESHTPP
jgi:hypothetical protein